MRQFLLPRIRKGKLPFGIERDIEEIVARLVLWRNQAVLFGGGGVGEHQTKVRGVVEEGRRGCFDMFRYRAFVYTSLWGTQNDLPQSVP